jgi:hypothetical protein
MAKAILKIRDSKRSSVLLEVEGPVLRIKTQTPYREWKEPHPHITVDNAREIVTAIDEFAHTRSVEDNSLAYKDERHFTIYGYFLDRKGNEIRVQESSACPVVYAWIFCHTPDGLHCEPELTREEALRLAGFLKAFIHDKSWHAETGECPICD